MERYYIPAHLISVLTDVISTSETHVSMDNLFMYADVSGDAPGGNKTLKAQEWLRRINKETTLDTLSILGKLIESYMDKPIEETSSTWTSDSHNYEWEQERKNKIKKALDRAGLTYFQGGQLATATGPATVSLANLIRSRNLEALTFEFDRAIKHVEKSPREAISAACNILESVCKVYIEEKGLGMPQKQDLQAVWKIVRVDLKLDPSQIENRDIQEILSGIIATVHGIGALRTHASSAHGAGKKPYTLKTRHARLAIHAAHTLTAFILETWEEKTILNSSSGGQLEANTHKL